MKIIDQQLFKIALIPLLIGFINCTLTGSNVWWVDNQCIRCIYYGYDFSSWYNNMMTTNGYCCSNLLQSGDYCSSSYPYSTVDYVGAAKYYWCPRDWQSNCNPSSTTTLYMTSSVQSISVTQSTYTVCGYKISTADIAAATTP